MIIRKWVHVLVLCLAAGGCVANVGALNPRPNVAISQRAPKYTIDVSRVPDELEAPRVHLREFRKTLVTGFQNATGNHFAPVMDPQAVRLVITETQLELANLGNIGRILTIRYRASWVAPDGEELAAVAGIARPRNPTEPGDRHAEDVIEVMLEEMIAGLDRAVRDRAPVPAQSAPASRAYL